MPDIPTTIRCPSKAEIREKAAKNHMELTDEEVDDFAELMPAALELYELLNEISEPKRNVTYADRDISSRPGTDTDPHNAFVTMCEVRGSGSGLLEGYNVGLKDNIALAGIDMTCGSKLFDDYVPSTDATVVTRLLDAGAMITGKMNMEDMALSSVGELSATGPVLNPHDKDYLAGGSSGGSAAAIVSGDIDIALGTDQAGSIRIPSSICGCVGLKPTYSLVPYTGIVPLGRTFDHVGPMATTVAECARTLDVIAGADQRDPRQRHVESGSYEESLLEGGDTVKIGTLEEGFGWEMGDSNVDETVRTSIERWEDAGSEIRSVSVPWHRYGTAIWQSIAREEELAIFQSNGIGHFGKGEYDTDLAAAFGKALQTQADDLPPTAKFALVVAQYMSDEYFSQYYSKAQNLGAELSQAYDEALSEVDVLALPTTPQTAFKYKSDRKRIEILRRTQKSFIVNTAPFNITGHPAISVPCGTVDHLPVGMMFVGKQFDDETVLRAAHSFVNEVGL